MWCWWYLPLSLRPSCLICTALLTRWCWQRDEVPISGLQQSIVEHQFSGAWVSQALVYGSVLDLLPETPMPAVRSVDGREVRQHGSLAGGVAETGAIVVTWLSHPLSSVCVCLWAPGDDAPPAAVLPGPQLRPRQVSSSNKTTHHHQQVVAARDSPTMLPG